MTPSLPELLEGCVLALGVPLPPEASGEYAQGRTGMVMTLLALAGQEAERAAGASAWENAALRDLFAGAARLYDADLEGRLSDLAAQADANFTLTALASANAELRRALIALHEAAEARGDPDLDRKILDLYRQIARAHRLDLPSALGG
ncbi:MAG: hypothetical protein ACYC8V_13705 [Caulobacteraceae bacterium]